MNTKTILGISFAAVFAIAMIGPASANGLPGWADLTSAESEHHDAKNHPNKPAKNLPERYTIEANTVGAFTTCPAESVCGIGSFIDSGSALDGVDAAMAVAAIHDPFCDHAFQHATCVPGGFDPVPSGGDADVPHPHVLKFNLAPGCNAFEGVELVGENDLGSSTLEITGTYLELKVPVSAEVLSLDSNVHTWTVAEGTGGEICPTILDTESDED